MALGIVQNAILAVKDFNKEFISAEVRYIALSTTSGKSSFIAFLR